MPMTQAERRVYDLARYHRRRQEAIALLGGVCVVCGTDERLELDHVDPTTKLFDLGTVWGRNEVEFWAEIKKCQLLCKPHHAQKTGLERRVDEHGTWGMVRNRKCKCDICKQFVRNYQRQYRAAYRASKRAAVPID